MKKVIFLVAAVAVAMTSCTKSETIGEGGTNAINVSGFVAKSTKASSALNQNFNVSAFLRNNGAATTGKTADFMVDQLVSCAAGVCTYTPVKFWPASEADLIDFYAYSPVDLTATTQFPLTVAYKDINTDIIVANAVDKNNASGTIAFEFKHALTKVAFKGKVTYPNGLTANDMTVTITKIAVQGVDASGSCKISSSPVVGDWTVMTKEPADEIAIPGISSNVLTDNFAAVGNAVYLIPQDLTDISVDVTYTVKQGESVTSPVTKNIALAGTDVWDSNKSLVYTLNFDLTDGGLLTPIDFSATVTDWDADKTVDKDIK